MRQYKNCEIIIIKTMFHLTATNAKWLYLNLKQWQQTDIKRLPLGSNKSIDNFGPADKAKTIGDTTLYVEETCLNIQALLLGY